MKTETTAVTENMELLPKSASGPWRAGFFSPKGLVCRALVLAFLFLLAHLCFLRECTSVLNGTTGSVNLAWQVSAGLGVIYVLLYLAAVLVAPILLLAAGILALWNGVSK